MGRTSALGLALLLIGCDGGGAPPPTPTGPSAPVAPESLSQAVQPILTRTCAFSQCHSGPTPQEGMDLSAGRTHASVVGVASRQVPRLLRVDPARPDSSYLLLKLRGMAGAVGGVGTQMPLGGALTAAQIDSVRFWIAAGAQNNE
ncbi:MAG: hypothetical protein KC645_13300 [Gemmatimonadetes bacterium]|nr:hypothetical protein [Gemmatimonadota bacterium]